MPTREIRHPLIRHKLGLMRRADISTKNSVSSLRKSERCSPTKPPKTCPWKATRSPVGRPVQVEKIAGKKITVVPILRAGIGMLEGVLSLIPGAQGQRRGRGSQ